MLTVAFVFVVLLARWGRAGESAAGQFLVWFGFGFSLVGLAASAKGSDTVAPFVADPWEWEEAFYGGPLYFLLILALGFLVAKLFRPRRTAAPPRRRDVAYAAAVAFLLAASVLATLFTGSSFLL